VSSKATKAWHFSKSPRAASDDRKATSCSGGACRRSGARRFATPRHAGAPCRAFRGRGVSIQCPPVAQPQFGTSRRGRHSTGSKRSPSCEHV
jgi:hypothetical protein